MSNSDQAKECISIAKKAFTAGDQEKAIKFLQKSIKLEPTSEAQVLLRAFSRKPEKAPPPPKAVPTSAASASPSPSPPPEQKPFTPEQRAEALAVLKKKDYYEVLGVARTATDKEIATAYRQLARRIHPDKNTAPEAEAAFKKLTQANECLSDENKRNIYDQTGHDEAQPTPGPQFRGFGGHPGFHQFQGGPLQPEDIFNLFFGGQGAHFQRRGARQRREDDDEPRHRQAGGGATNFSQLLQFLPLLFLLLFSFLANSNISSSSSSSSWSGMSSGSPFQMEYSAAYPIRKLTSFNAPYFVSNTFDRRYGRDLTSLRSIESTVDARYLKILEEKCKNEQKELQKLDHAVLFADTPQQREERLRRKSDFQAKSKWCEKVEDFMSDQHSAAGAA